MFTANKCTILKIRNFIRMLEANEKRSQRMKNVRSEQRMFEANTECSDRMKNVCREQKKSEAKKCNIFKIWNFIRMFAANTEMFKANKDCSKWTNTKFLCLKFHKKSRVEKPTLKNIMQCLFYWYLVFSMLCICYRLI